MDFDRVRSAWVFRVDLQNFYDALQERAAYLHQQAPACAIFSDCVWLITQQVGSSMLILCLSNNKGNAISDDRLLIVLLNVNRVYVIAVYFSPYQTDDSNNAYPLLYPPDLISNVLSGATRFIINAMIPGIIFRNNLTATFALAVAFCVRCIRLIGWYFTAA